jgi:hypothetical protein
VAAFLTVLHAFVMRFRDSSAMAIDVNETISDLTARLTSLRGSL